VRSKTDWGSAYSNTLTRTAVEHGLRVRVISPIEKEKVYGGKDLLNCHV